MSPSLIINPHKIIVTLKYLKYFLYLIAVWTFQDTPEIPFWKLIIVKCLLLATRYLMRYISLCELPTERKHHLKITFFITWKLQTPPIKTMSTTWKKLVSIWVITHAELFLNFLFHYFVFVWIIIFPTFFIRFKL